MAAFQKDEFFNLFIDVIKTITSTHNLDEVLDIIAKKETGHIRVPRTLTRREENTVD